MGPNAEKVISSPQSELAHFRESLDKKSMASFGDAFEKLPEQKQVEAIQNAVIEHQQTAPQKMAPEFAARQKNAEALVLALSPEEDDEVMESLLGMVEENGILNTINAIEKTESFHIKDDFHRFLVQYIKAGYPSNIKESNPIYPGLHMTLFEVALPESSDEKQKEKTLELLLSSMEQFYAGMFSVAENGRKNQNYFSIEIAYPQGRSEVVFFSAVPDDKKNIFKNQVLAIFPNASIKENTDDYNIFNKSEHISYSEVSLEKSSALPIKTYKELNYDPLNILLESFSNLEASEGAAIQIMLSPDDQDTNKKLVKALDKIAKGEDIDSALKLKESFLSGAISFIDKEILSSKDDKKEVEDSERRSLISEEIKKKNTSRFYKTNIRLISSGNNQPHADAILSELESAFFQFENTLGNKFKFSKFSGRLLNQKIKDYTFRVFDDKRFSYLNTTELTTIFHFPEVSLNAGDILATSSFASAGVSKKLAQGALDQPIAEEQNLAPPAVFRQPEPQVPQPENSIARENIEIPQSKESISNNARNFVLEKPDESWVRGGGSFSANTHPEPQPKNPNTATQDFSAAPENASKTTQKITQQNSNLEASKISNTKNSQQNLGDASFSGMKDILLGFNVHQGVRTDIYMKAIDRMRHMYVIGKSGVGKTNILKNMIIQDIQNGDGCCFIDPHGSDIEDILSQIPEHRHKDVIYFDPTNVDRPMGMNMMEYDPNYPEQKTFVVDELFGIFKKLYSGTPESMGPAFEQYFRNATLLVLDHPESGNTMVEISRVLSDEDFRNLKLKHCKNMIVKQFWEKIATQAGGDAELANIVPYITNKFDVFLANDFMRPIIAQEKSAFNMREVMDNKKILLINLSKGKLGELNSNLIGLIIVGKILMAALSRVDSLDKNLPPFYLYIDEFQNVTTDSISQILSEARKYKLSLNIAHQFIKQIDEKIRDAVFGNVGSMAVFRVGPEDAEFLEKQLAPTFTSTDIMGLKNYNAYIKMLVDGEPQKPFNIQTIAPSEGNPEIKDYLKRKAAQELGRDRAEIEEEVNRKFSSML